ncbi:MAG TPA: hypothetical protein VFK32_08510, partial [Tepidiformaceae bacterium]|nr:hypothetical protein [Tepidiformaceae bacterium]
KLATQFDVATLWVLDGNTRARRFYEKSGWRSDGATQTVDEGPAAGLMELRLRSTLSLHRKEAPL